MEEDDLGIRGNSGVGNWISENFEVVMGGSFVKQCIEWCDSISEFEQIAIDSGYVI